MLLILRNDNLPAAITACSNGKWVVKTGNDSFDFIKEITEVDLCKYLQSKCGYFNINP